MLRFNSGRFNRSSYSSRQIAFDAIMKVVDRGISMMSSDLTEDMFQVWFYYSKDILEMVATEQPYMLMNYLDLNIALLKDNIAPNDKLKLCTEYLLEIAKKI